MNDTYKNTEKLKDNDFKRAVGVKREVFKKMLNIYEDYEVKKMKLGGRKSSLSAGNKVLIMLEYHRKYRTQFHMSTSYRVSESTISRVIIEVEKVLIRSGEFTLPGKKFLEKKDSFEIKGQIVIGSNKQIICCMIGKGKEHDFNLFKRSKLNIKMNIPLFADSGYLGINKYYQNSKIPIKSSKLYKLTKEDKKESRLQSSKRILVENVNAQIKTFKIFNEKYRNRRKRFGLRFNLVCSLINMERGF